MSTFRAARHSGKIGDLLYSLPVVRQLGVRTFYVKPDAPTDPLGVPLAEEICELLRMQPYIDTAEVWTDQYYDLDLDRFRDVAYAFHRCHLTECHWQGIGRYDPLDRSPWLTVPVEPTTAVPVVINRTLRNSGQRFPWRWITDKVKERLQPQRPIFVGTLDEYSVFHHLCDGRMFLYLPPTFMDFVRMVASCKYFIGNQSAGWVIAEGLDKRRLLESNPRHPCAQPLSLNGTTSADEFLTWMS